MNLYLLIPHTSPVWPYLKSFAARLLERDAALAKMERTGHLVIHRLSHTELFALGCFAARSRGTN